MKVFRFVVIGLVGIALIAGIGFSLFQRQIGEAVYKRVVAENVGRDRAAELPDGLHVFLCGTGSPMPDPGRAGPCIGVVAGTRAFVFDTGSGSARVLGRMGFPIGRLERIYLTHLHSDHFDGIGEFMLQAWVGGSRKAPLPISGPTGIADVVAGFNAAYIGDSRFRTGHHGIAVADPAGFGLVSQDVVLPAAPDDHLVVLQDGDLTITAIGVSHAPISPAFGYRIDYKGRSIAISGDTIYDPEFAVAARGVDVLFHEALEPNLVGAMHDAAHAKGLTSIAKITTDITNYHATPEDAARVAAEAGADELVYYHIIPPLPSRLFYAAFVGDARKVFKGRVRVGEDGMLVSLPAGTAAIRTTRAVQ